MNVGILVIPVQQPEVLLAKLGQLGVFHGIEIDDATIVGVNIVESPRFCFISDVRLHSVSGVPDGQPLPDTVRLSGVDIPQGFGLADLRCAIRVNGAVHVDVKEVMPVVEKARLLATA